MQQHDDPSELRAHFDAIVALVRTGQLQKAESEVRAILNVRNDDRNFLHLHGIVLAAQNRHDDAIAYFRQALTKKPDWPEARFNIAQSMLAKGVKEEARDLFQQLVKLPNAPKQHWMGLAKAEQACGNLSGTKDALTQAQRLDPDDRDLTSWMVYLARQICDWKQIAPLDKVTPGVLVTLTDDPLRVRFAGEFYCNQKYKDIKPLPTVTAAPKQKLRIGYLSCDFQEHATAYLLAELFELHDRNAFEIFVYSYGKDDSSQIRNRIAKSTGHFIDVSNLTAANVASRIRSDGIDILVDLKGHTRGGRLEIMARRPAPIQMHWLGFPGSTGAAFIDYFIADAITVPPGNEQQFTEKILRLPNSYQINDRLRPLPTAMSRMAHGLPEGVMVLACFNQTYKITPEQFNVWVSLFRDLPESILWLYATNPDAARNITEYAKSVGLAEERLLFAQPTTQAEHLARYHHVDMMLDTFPVGGHTTTSDALWMGTPVVTREGSSFVSRAACSLLHAVGLDEMVAGDTAEYRAIAIKLGQDIDERQRIKNHLVSNREKLALFDTPRFVRNLEHGYHLAWDRAAQGQGPTTMDVPEDNHT